MKLEEVEREEDKVVVSFGFSINAQPKVATFAIEGLATVKADEQVVSRLFQISSNNQVPEIANEIYKHVYTSVFVLASLIGITPPSPGLLHSPRPAKMPQEPLESDAAADAGQDIPQSPEPS